MKGWIIGGYINDPRDNTMVSIQYTSTGCRSIDEAIEEAREYGVRDIFEARLSTTEYGGKKNGI